MGVYINQNNQALRLDGTNSAAGIFYDNTTSGLQSDSVQGAVDEVVVGLGTKQNATDNSLTTTAKTVTGAINEVNGNKQDKTDNSLTTTAKTIVGGINELNSKTIHVANISLTVNTNTTSKDGALGGYTLNITDYLNNAISNAGIDTSKILAIIPQGGRTTLDAGRGGFVYQADSRWFINSAAQTTFFAYFVIIYTS